jgi:hypothetical protein
MGKESEGKELEFEQVREEIEAKQRAILWPDALRNGRTIHAFLWKGDPNAKPVQRAGLVVLALFFLLWTVYIATTYFEEYSEDRSAFGFVTGLVLALISVRLFRNALLRPPKHQEKEDDYD